jgi:hypothetical protein
MEKQTKDMHFSGYVVSNTLITALLAFGFVRDLFTNNTRCATTQFHATYKGDREINDELYEEMCILLKKHPDTVADLEMESSLPKYRIEIAPTPQEPLNVSEIITPFSLKDCPIGIKKAADIHIACNVMESSAYAFHFMENLKMVSFDRPLTNGFKRVYTLTFEDTQEALLWFERFKNVLEKLHMFSGKVKLEFLQKQFRMPEDAPVLPLVEL